jgi:glucose/arabinose dehydrogenase
MNILPKILFTLLFFNTCYLSTKAQLPNGFVDETVSTEWNISVGLTFDANGRMYVWEKGGKVFIVENGQKQPNPLIDISEEVLNFNDHGLNGFALDPNFLSNGYIYLLYAAKRYYVQNFGTNNYNKNTNDEEPFKTTIGRLVRYKANISDGFRSVDYQSRKILIGETLSTGIPILVDNHGVGSLVFGEDGTLLLSAGDAAIIQEPLEDDSQNPWFLEAINLGIITPDQNVGAYRSQVLNSLNGKILRINANTGDGISSNPFFETNNSRSAKSRIWAYGLRNPFRFSIKPKTGSNDPNDAQPGIIFAGDVGWSHREELNIIPKGGLNFGWPTYEGISFINENMKNEAFLPQNHQKPVIDWRGPIAQAYIEGQSYDIGTPQFGGDAFTGNASIGGVWYPDNTIFPEEFRNTYFHGDYMGWIKSFTFNATLTPQKVVHFSSDVHPTCLAIHPITGMIYYVNYSYPATNEIRRIFYKPNANLKPLVAISANKIYGASPLEVQFIGNQSKDPENKPLKYEWDFGDKTSSSEANPRHIYTIPLGEKIKFTATLTVTDDIGQSSSKSIDIFVGSFPPIILSTSLDTLSQFENGKDFLVKLDARIENADKEKFTYQWLLTLHHDDHTHFQTAINTQQGQMILGSVPCDEQSYFYRIELKVTDALGLSSEIYQDIKPICKKINENPPTTNGKLTLFALKKDNSTALLKWAVVIKNTGGYSYEVYRNGQLLRRLLQGTTSVEVPLAASLSEYQIIAKDNAGNSVKSNLVAITNNTTLGYSFFSFNQLVILTDILIAQIEREGLQQMRLVADCPENLLTIDTGSSVEKISKEKIISNENIKKNTLYNSGKSILLEAGFKVENGAIFETKINGCY